MRSRRATWAGARATTPWPSPQARAPLERLAHGQAGDDRRPKICAAGVLPAPATAGPRDEAPAQEPAATSPRRSRVALGRAVGVAVAVWACGMTALYLAPRTTWRSASAEESVAASEPVVIVVDPPRADDGVGADVARFAYESTCRPALDASAAGDAWIVLDGLARAREQATFFEAGVVPADVTNALGAPVMTPEAAALADACARWNAAIRDDR